MSSCIKTFGARVKKCREERGWSQAELAKQTGLTPSGVAHFEADRREPRVTNIVRLARALDVSVDYLVGTSDTPEASDARSTKISNLLSKMKSEDVGFLEKMAEELARRNTQK